MSGPSTKTILSVDNVEAAIRETAQRDFQENVVDQLEAAITSLKSTFRERVLMPQIPTVSVRVSTLQMLLMGVADSVPPNSSETLRRVGKLVGKDFARSVENHLETFGFVPTNQEVLLRAWALLDGGAGWGQFKTSFADEDGESFVNVELRNSSLISGDQNAVSPTLEFLAGYIQGVCWELLKYSPRRLRENGVVAAAAMEPTNVTINLESEVRASFLLTLKREELTESYDQLYRLRRLVRSNDLRSIGAEFRKTLELGLKEKISAEGRHFQIPDLAKAYKEAGIHRNSTINFDIVERLYYQWNPDAHGVMNVNLVDAVSWLRTVEEIFDQLELYEIGASRRRDIMNKATERQQRHQSRESTPNIRVGSVNVTAGSNAHVNVAVGNGANAQQDTLGGDSTRTEVFDILDELISKLDAEDPTQSSIKSSIDDLIKSKEEKSAEELSAEIDSLVSKLAPYVGLTSLALALSRAVGLA